MMNVVNVVKLVVVIVLCLASGIAHADRIALVIGNSSYSKVPVLENPRNDAVDIAATLEDLDFDVQVALDLTHAATLDTLRKFQKEALRAKIAIVYYAGHGIEIENRNYLIPIDAVLDSDRDVVFETIPLSSVVQAASGAEQLSIVILDACRNNPFEEQMLIASGFRSIGRGLAPVEPSGNTVVAYSAKAGTVAWDGDGRNSPYASAWLNVLKRPQLEIGLLFREVRDHVLRDTRNQQEPFWYGSLSSEELFLNNKEPEAVAPPEPIEPVAARPAPAVEDKFFAKKERLEEERAVWDAVKNSGDADQYEMYISLYPDSPFTPFARLSLKKLRDGTAAPDTKVTALLDPKRSAAADRPEKAPVATTATALQPAPPAQDTPPANRPAVQPKEPKPNDVSISRLGASPQPDTEPDKKVAALAAPNPESIPEADEAPKGVEPVLSREEIADLQLRLTILGFSPGPADGLSGPRTQKAVLAFEKERDLEEIGKPSSKILSLLRAAVTDEEVESAMREIERQRQARIEQRRKAAAAAAAKRRQQQIEKQRAAAEAAKAEAARAAAEKARAERRKKNRSRRDNDRGGRSSGGGGGSCSGMRC